MADRTGQQLGNYRLVRMLGRGGFAEVYLGEHRYLKGYAALKVLSVSIGEAETRSFLAEAQTLYRLTHPHIIRVREFGVESGTPVLVMDYAPGGTLRQRHPRGSCLSLTTIVEYVDQIANALQYAHNHHIIHRDVKPENILLDASQQLLLSDFGVALLAPLPELLSTQQWAGTLAYSAPEQIRGKQTFASDQYALGIMTYEWLCGQRPFEGVYWSLVHQQLYIAPQPLRKDFPEVPAAVEEVVLRALAKEPQQRFSSVQAFAYALARAVHEHDDVDEGEITATRQVVVAASTPSRPHVLPGSSMTGNVFLSASPADETFVTRLKADLLQRGITIANTTDTAQEETLRQAVRASGLVLIVISPHTRSSKIVKEHLRIASMYQRRLVFLWASGDDVVSMLLDAWGKTRPIDVIDARGTRYETALSEIEACIEENSARSPIEDFSLSPAQNEPRNPFKGLRPFTLADAPDFFGRDALIEDLTQAVQDVLMPPGRGLLAERLLAVVGPSGSGKSSVVMAGLLPHLQQGALPGSEKWVYIDPFVPGKRPIEALASALAPHLSQATPSAIYAVLANDSLLGLHQLANRILQQREGRLVLVIDQFEELFTQAIFDEERRHFIDLLLNAITIPSGPVLIVITLRADFYDRPLHYTLLGKLIEQHHRSVLPLELHELRAVIEKPAAQKDVQLIFEGNLLGDLLFETFGQAGALPLLQFTLDQLFQQRESHWLTTQAYQKMGGVKGALAKHAETTFAALPSDEQRALARVLFLRLIDPGATLQESTRRRAALRELVLPDDRQSTRLYETANAFVTARLLTVSEVASSKTIEVSHEALIREWPRLTEWLRRAHDDVLIQKAISTDATEWHKRDEPLDRLYRGNQLHEAKAWAERNLPSVDEVSFLKAALMEHQRQEDEEQRRFARELMLKRQTVNRLRMLVVALSLFLAASVVLASVIKIGSQQLQTENQIISINIAKISSQNATEAALLKQSISHNLVTEANIAASNNQLDLALLLSVEATKQSDTNETRNNLLKMLETDPQLVTILHGDTNDVATLSFGPDSHTLLAANSQGIYTWDTQTRKSSAFTLTTLEAKFPDAVALSPDGHMLVTTNGSGVWLWNYQTGMLITKLAGPVNYGQGRSDTTALAFSSDSKLVASSRCIQFTSDQTSCSETHILIWNVQTTSSTPTGNPFIVSGNVASVAFDINSTTIAAGGTTGIQVWDMVTHQQLSALLTTGEDVSHITFSPDGKKFAAGSNGKNAKAWLWPVSYGQPIDPPLQLTGHTNSITGVAFNKDGTMLASSSMDQTVHLWTVASGAVVSVLKDTNTAKTQVAFSPDGTTVAAGSDGGDILLWQVKAQGLIRHQLASVDNAYCVIYNADHTQLITGSDDGKVVVQDIKTGNALATLDTTVYPAVNQEGGPAIQSLALDRQGQLLVAGRSDGMIVAWDMKTRKALAHFTYKGSLFKTMLSADGQIVATEGDGDLIMLWRLTRKAGTVTITQLPSLHAYTPSPIAALSPDGQLLAIGDCMKTSSSGTCIPPAVRIWNVSTRQSVTLLSTKNLATTIQDIAFSSDGKQLAVSAPEGIFLWQNHNGWLFSQWLSLAHSDEYYDALLFSPNGDKLVSYSYPDKYFSFVVWDITRKEAFVDAFREGNATGGSIAFRPDSQQLAEVFVPPDKSQSITILLDISVPLWQKTACSLANRPLTKEEWNQYLGGIAYERVCSDFSL